MLGWGPESNMKAGAEPEWIGSGLRVGALALPEGPPNTWEKRWVGLQARVQGLGRNRGGIRVIQVRSILLPKPVTVFFPSAVRGPRLDFGCLLQCSSTSAPRLGHVRVRDGFCLFPPLPGRVPLWHGDSDWGQLELPGKGFFTSLSGKSEKFINISFCPEMPDPLSHLWAKKGQTAGSANLPCVCRAEQQGPSLWNSCVDRAEQSFYYSFMS